MHALKWVKKIDEKEDLEKYGLKTPAAVIQITVKNTPTSAAGAVGALAGNLPISAAGFIVAVRQAEKGDVVTISLGKETDVEKDKPAIYAMHSGSKLIFLLPTMFLKEVRDSDFRDRATQMHAEGRMIASMVANAGVLPINLLMLDSPYVSGQIFDLDADKIKQIRIEERTPYELRSFDFQRDPKDKSWFDKSNIPEFRIDPDKVTQFAKEISKLKADRFVAFVGGPRGEHKLAMKQATVKLDLTMEDGRAITLMVGATSTARAITQPRRSGRKRCSCCRTRRCSRFCGAPQFAKERLGAN